MDFNDVFNFENLYNSYKECKKGVMWKSSTQNYNLHAVKNITQTLKELHNGTYKAKPYHSFTLRERGKVREINSVHITDRVVQKCFTTYCLTPLLVKRLIYDSGACLKGKGMLFTTNRLKCHLQRYYRQNKSNKGYILIFDYSKFFNSIDHSMLLEKVALHLKNTELLNYFKTLLKTFGEKGLALGSDTSQISALYYLSEIDHFIKQKLKAKYYGRYMDDAYIIHSDKTFLNKCKSAIIEISKQNKLTLNENKTKIMRIDKGFTFLNRRWQLTENNYIKTKPSHKTMARIKKKYKKLVKINLEEKQLKAFKGSINGFLKFYKNERLIEYVYN